MSEDLDEIQAMFEARQRKRKDAPKEWRLHAAAAKLCYKRERADPTFRFFSPGGEGQRTPQRAAIAKMMGQNRAGVPDLWLLRPGKIWVVEFKRPGKQLTAVQLDWFNWCHDSGYESYRCTKLDHFRSILDLF